MQLTYEEIAVVWDEAYRKNITITALSQSLEGVRDTLRDGADTSGQGSLIDEVVEFFSEANVF